MLKYLFVIIAYLIGSIPFSYILGKYIKKDDIRQHGSGNLGATNAFRVFGAIIGISVLILDTLKSGLIILFVNEISETTSMFPAIIYGVVAVIGHIFPVWMKFKGGKGVASAFGILLFFYWPLPLALVPIFFITLVISKYVSLASTVVTLTAFIFALLLFFIGGTPIDLVFVISTAILVLLILFKHRTNYQRIYNGTENRVVLRKR